MQLPTPEKRATLDDAETFFQTEQYRKDLQVLAKAKAYVERVFEEESAIDYMITEIKNYFRDGKFSDHCYEYAEKEAPPLTEEEIAKLLPKGENGKAIFSWKDL